MGGGVGHVTTAGIAKTQTGMEVKTSLVESKSTLIPGTSLNQDQVQMGADAKSRPRQEENVGVSNNLQSKHDKQI